MARVVKAEEYTVKRNEILDVAQRIIYTTGYEQMSIQDILNDLKISKGAFYHYFSSKQALLEALIDRLLQQAVQILTPIVNNPQLTPLQKLDLYFTATSSWKTSNKDYLLALLPVWFDDRNAVFRQKVQATTISTVVPMLTQIIHEGVHSGVLKTPYPDQAGAVVMAVLQGLGEALARLLLSSEKTAETFPRMRASAAAYTDALERVLGAPAGSIRLVDDAILKEWIVEPNDRLPAGADGHPLEEVDSRPPLPSDQHPPQMEVQL